MLKGLLCESAGIPAKPANGLGLGACVVCVGVLVVLGVLLAGVVVVVVLDGVVVVVVAIYRRNDESSYYFP